MTYLIGAVYMDLKTDRVPNQYYSGVSDGAFLNLELWNAWNYCFFGKSLFGR